MADRKVLLERTLLGCEPKSLPYLLCQMNLVLHGIRHAKLKRANSLSDMGGLSEDDLRRRYKVILANPPYGTGLTFPLAAYVRCHQTSGSTTVPRTA